MLKTTARGQGQHQCFVRPPHYPNTTIPSFFDKPSLYETLLYVKFSLLELYNLTISVPYLPNIQRACWSTRKPPCSFAHVRWNTRAHDAIPLCVMCPHNFTKRLHIKRSEPSAHIGRHETSPNMPHIGTCRRVRGLRRDTARCQTLCDEIITCLFPLPTRQGLWWECHRTPQSVGKNGPTFACLPHIHTFGRAR